MAALFDKQKAKNLLELAKQKTTDAVNSIDPEAIKNAAAHTSQTLAKTGTAAAHIMKEGSKVAAQKLGEAGAVIVKTASETGASASQKISTLVSTAGDTAANMKDQLTEMKEQIQNGGYSEKAFETTQNLISTLSKMPIVRVNRDEFLKKVFANSPYLDQILLNGPPSVYSVDSLRIKATEIISNSTRKTSVVSFAAGLASNPLVMAVSIPTDITQFFAFALNLGQKIAYLFGEDQLFMTFDPTDDLLKNDGGMVPEEAQIKMLSYLGTMLGVSGASSLIVQTSKTAGASIGKKVAAQALTKTTWYPIVKKVGSVMGYKITKKTVENFISKSVPLVGGFISGGLTFVTFKPLGGRLADVFVKLTKGDYDINLDLNPEFLKTLGTSDEELDKEIIEGQFEDILLDDADDLVQL